MSASGAKTTWLKDGVRSAYDPLRTWAQVKNRRQ
jgi:hypothetical protein